MFNRVFDEILKYFRNISKHFETKSFITGCVAKVLSVIVLCKCLCFLMQNTSIKNAGQNEYFDLK